MPEELLPEEFDVFIYGTGMPESIAAAAYSRSGLRVLHIDRSDNYGSFWATHTLEQLTSLAHGGLSNGSAGAHAEVAQHVPLNDGEKLIHLRINEQVFQVEERWYIPTVSELLHHDAPLNTSDPSIPASEAPAETTEAVNASTGHEQETASHESPMDVSETSGAATAVAEVNSGEEVAQLSSSDTHGHEAQQSSERSVVSNTAASNSNQLTRESLLEKSRHFLIDFNPKLLFADGELIHLLVSSNVAQYVEFVAIDRLLTSSQSSDAASADPARSEGTFDSECIPCTRSELFNTRRLTLAEKRLMTNLVSFCTQQAAASNLSDDEATSGQSFGALVRERFRLTDKLVRFVAVISALMHNGGSPQGESNGHSHSSQSQAVSAQNSAMERFLLDVSVATGINAMRRFVGSLGRYGNATPFLVTRFGTNEIVQGFTRFSAVFGGVYCLRRQPTALVVAPSTSDDAKLRCVAVILDNGQRISVQSALLSSELTPGSDSPLACGDAEIAVQQNATETQFRVLLRSVFITDKSAFLNASGIDTDSPRSRNLLVLPVPSSAAGQPDSVAILTELDSSSGCVPRGFMLVHVVSVRSYPDASTMYRDVPVALNHLVDYVTRTVFCEYDSSRASSVKPAVLYRCSFAIKDCSALSNMQQQVPLRFRFLSDVGNVFSFSGHDATDPDCSRAVKEVRQLFDATIGLYPDVSRDFLPRAPDPEDIVIDGEPSNANGSTSDQAPAE